MRDRGAAVRARMLKERCCATPDFRIMVVELADQRMDCWLKVGPCLKDHICHVAHRTPGFCLDGSSRWGTAWGTICPSVSTVDNRTLCS